MKKFWSSLFIVWMSMALLVAGCGKELTAKEVLDKAIDASSNMTSYEYEAKVQMNFTPPASLLAQQPEAAMIIEMLKNAELSVKGVYQEDPMQMEMVLNLALTGDFGMTFNIPFIATEDKLWIKIPNIPMLSAFLPAELQGKFIELDLEELEELDAELAGMSAAIDLETQKQLGLEVFQVLSDSFADQEHLTLSKASDISLPEQIEATDVIQFTITDQNLEAAVKTIIHDVIPGVFEVLEKPDYAELFQIEADELDELKQEIQIDESEIQEALDELAEVLKINEISVTTALDKDYHIPYQEITFDFDVIDQGESMNMSMTIQMQLSNINQDVEFEIGIPSDEDTLTLSDFDELFSGYMDPAMMGLGEDIHWDMNDDNWDDDWDDEWLFDEEIDWENFDSSMLEGLEEFFSPEEWEQLLNELEAFQ